MTNEEYNLRQDETRELVDYLPVKEMRRRNREFKLKEKEDREKRSRMATLLLSMNRGLCIFLFVFILLMSCASAEQQTLGTFKQNDSLNLIQNCINSTYANVSRIVYPDSTLIINEQLIMEKNGDDYNLTFLNTTKLGNYVVYGLCDENGIKTNWVYDFKITKNGEENVGDNFNLFIYIIFIVATLGLFCTFIVGLAKLAMLETSIYDVLLSWVFIVLMVITNYISNYQMNDFVSSLSGQFLSVTSWSNGVLPLISLMVCIIVRSMQKQRPLSVQEITGRGLMKYG